LSNAKRKARSRGGLGPQIKFIVAMAAGLRLARADANQVETALLNLAVNLRDAMLDGGNLTTSASAEQAERRHPTGQPAGSYVRLAVSDTGLGMDEETLAQAIQPFFSTKGVGQGTGLGLRMVRGLAAQLGGASPSAAVKALGRASSCGFRSLLLKPPSGCLSRGSPDDRCRTGAARR